MNAAAVLRSIAFAAAALAPAAHAATPAEILAGYGAQAGAPAAAARGQQLFVTGHGALPVRAGKHAATGKPIEPLAPAANAARFSDPAKVEKWFRRNCNDVLGRECTPAEKADVLAWLMALKP